MPLPWAGREARKGAHVMNRAFGVDEYARSSRKSRREGRARLKPKRWTVLRWVGAAVVLVLALSMGLVQARTAAGNPDHFAGDYVIFAKALTPTVTTDLETRETSCNGLGSNNSQGEAAARTTPTSDAFTATPTSRSTGPIRTRTRSRPTPRSHTASTSPETVRCSRTSAACLQTRRTGCRSISPTPATSPAATGTRPRFKAHTR